MECNVRSTGRSIRLTLVLLCGLSLVPIVCAGVGGGRASVGWDLGGTGDGPAEGAWSALQQEPEASQAAPPAVEAPAVRPPRSEDPHEARLQAEAPGGEGAAARADAALRRAADFLAVSEPQPHLFLFLDVFYRRYGLERFRDSRARYDDLMHRSGPEVLPYMRGLRRMLDPDNTPEPGGRYPCMPNVDLLVCPALYCDRLPAPSSYVANLRASLAAGRKDLTHVGFAMMLARDLGCQGFVPADVEAVAIDGMTKLVEQDGRVTDLELEAAMLLSYLGHGDHLPGGYTEEVLANQRPSGGWAMDSADRQRPGHWHATCWAAWYLLESRPASAERPPIVPRR